jgi:RNAse (barnase) inhibitor barstar
VNAVKYHETNKVDIEKAMPVLQLSESVRKACSAEVKQSGPSRVLSTLQYIPGKNILYCPVEKIGTTFWRRVFYTFAFKHSKDKLPFDIPEELAQEEIKDHFSKSYSSDFPTDYFSFMFVRNPFSRLLSAYVDKIVAPNPFYWRQFGALAVNKYRQNVNKTAVRGHDISFAEFVRLATDMESTNMYKDPHIKSIGTSCHPCHHNYSFIGRMENFKEDSLYVLKKIEAQNEMMKTLDSQWDTLSTKASIEVNIEYWFDSKSQISKYISWEKALKRFWLYMQMRGLIEKRLPLNITTDNVEKISAKDFENLVKEANNASNKAELSKQKRDVKIEAFSSVEPSLLKKFVYVFRKDFELYGYDPSPSYIFQRGDTKITTKFFNYSHLN